MGVWESAVIRVFDVTEEDRLWKSSCGGAWGHSIMLEEALTWNLWQFSERQNKDQQLIWIQKGA